MSVSPRGVFFHCSLVTNHGPGVVARAQATLSLGRLARMCKNPQDWGRSLHEIERQLTGGDA
jgi:hypothetical protein